MSTTYDEAAQAARNVADGPIDLDAISDAALACRVGVSRQAINHSRRKFGSLRDAVRRRAEIAGMSIDETLTPDGWRRGGVKLLKATITRPEPVGRHTLTQTELADRVGVSKQAIYALRQKFPSLHAAVSDRAKAAGLSIDEILTPDGWRRGAESVKRRNDQRRKERTARKRDARRVAHAAAVAAAADPGGDKTLGELLADTTELADNTSARVRRGLALLLGPAWASVAVSTFLSTHSPVDFGRVWAVGVGTVRRIGELLRSAGVDAEICRLWETYDR